MTKSQTYALIGAGNLGTPVARRLLDNWFDLTVCDRDQTRLRPLAVKGAKTTTSVADCASHDVILSLVRTEAELSEVVEEIACNRPGNAPKGRLVVLGTVPAIVLQDAAKRLAPVSISVVDAPVSGGAARARAGELTIMVGGANADIAALNPVFATLANHVFHCGGVGAGQAVKIVNNVLCHGVSVLMGEAMRLGLSQGLDPEIIAQVMEVSTGRNWLSAQPGLAAEVLGAQSVDRATFDGILAILQKDMVIAAELSDDAPGAYPMIKGVSDLIGGLGDETFETWRAVAEAGNDKSQD